MVAQFQQNFIYELEQRKFLDDEYTIRPILPIFQKFSIRLRKQFILNCPKVFIKFLSKCLVNLLRRELRDLRKEYVVKYRKETSELTQKNSSKQKKNYFKFN